MPGEVLRPTRTCSKIPRIHAGTGRAAHRTRSTDTRASAAGAKEGLCAIDTSSSAAHRRAVHDRHDLLRCPLGVCGRPTRPPPRSIGGLCTTDTTSSAAHWGAVADRHELLGLSPGRNRRTTEPLLRCAEKRYPEVSTEGLYDRYSSSV